MRILGLDVGDVRIGVAITDKSGTIASPLTVIKNDDQARENLNKIIKENSIEKIIVGLPYNLKGEVAFQAKKVIDFIENNIKSYGVEVELIDERFTSKISLKALDKKVKKKQGQKQGVKGAIDKVSAAVLLNDYLDKIRNKKTE
jgi:putative Holliday junction resolvase